MNNTFSFEIFADYFQVLFFDSSAKDQLIADFSAEDIRNRAVVFNQGLVVFTARNMDVPVIVNIQQQKPVFQSFEAWDHVIETGIDLPSGQLMIGGIMDSNDDCLHKITLSPGYYGVSILFSGLDSLDECGLTGNDSYQLIFYPLHQQANFQVLKYFD